MFKRTCALLMAIVMVIGLMPMPSYAAEVSDDGIVVINDDTETPANEPEAEPEGEDDVEPDAEPDAAPEGETETPAEPQGETETPAEPEGEPETPVEPEGQADVTYIAYIGETGYESLEAAVNAVAQGESATITLSAGTHVFPNSGIYAGKKLVFQGGEGVVIDATGLGNEVYGDEITFNNLTMNFPGTSHKGITHTNKVVFNNCILTGTQTLYAADVDFNSCTFNVSGDAYAVWTYGASDVTFTDCVFNTDGKAILVYTEAAHTAAINVSGCTFNATASLNKAAVEVGADVEAHYTLNITNSTADDNFVADSKGVPTGSNLWGNKNSISGEGLKVTIDNEVVYGPAPSEPEHDWAVDGIASVDDLLAFAAAVNAGDTFAGKTVKLAADIDLAGIQWQPIGGSSVYFAGEFDGNGKTISNLTNTEDVARKGLFGLVEDCYIHDLTLKDVKFSGAADAMRVGALAGNLNNPNWNGTGCIIENITVDGLDYDLNDTAGLIGGLIGFAWNSHVVNCVVKNADMNVASTGGSSVGGMIGYGRGVTDNCYVEDFPTYGDNINSAYVRADGGVINYVGCDVQNITANLSGTVSFGGFFGADTYNHWRNTFKSCEVTGLDVTCAEGEGVYTVGGFMSSQAGGYSPDAIDDCHVTGSITSYGTNPASSFGGFIGGESGRSGGATNCTANVTINVAAGTVGGFCGSVQQYNDKMSYTFDGCTASGDVTTGNGIAGGFLATASGSDLNLTIEDCTVENEEAGLIGNVASETGSITLKNNNVSTVGGNTAIIATNWIDVADTSWYVEGQTEFTITTPEQLAGLAKLTNDGDSTFTDIIIRLGADIDLAGLEWTPIGSYNTKDAAGNHLTFSGYFEGQDYTISNLYINQPNSSNQGLFGYAAILEIRDLTLHNVDVKGKSYSSALLGENTNAAGTISNIKVTGKAILELTNYEGGLILGTGPMASIENITIDVSDDSYVKSNNTRDNGNNGDSIGSVFGGYHNVQNAKNITSNVDVYGRAQCVGGIGGGSAKYSENLTYTGNVYVSEKRTGNYGHYHTAWKTNGLIYGKTNDATVKNAKATGTLTVGGEVITSIFAVGDEDLTMGFRLNDTRFGGFNTVIIIEPNNSAYVSNNNGVVTIWGEMTNADPETELYMNILASDGTVMGKVVLNDVDGIYEATTYSLTWHAMVIGEEYDTYWTTTWNEGYPNGDAQPAYMALYIDGVLVNTAPINMSGPDDLNPVVWKDLFPTYAAEVNGTKYETLYEAIRQAFHIYGDVTVNVLADGTMHYSHINDAVDMFDAFDISNITLNLNGHTVTVDGEVVVTYGDSLTITGNGSMVFEGTGALRAILTSNGTTGTKSAIIIENGTFTNNTEGTAIIADANAVLTVNNGTFSSAENVPAIGVASSGTVTLIAGTYPATALKVQGTPNVTKTADLAVTAPEGYYWENDTTLKKGSEYVAYIGETGYKSLEAAFAAAKDGETITLVADCATAKTIKVAPDKPVTLDLNGKKLSTAESFSGMDMFTVSGSLTVKGEGSIHSSCDSMFNGNVTIEGNGTYTGEWTVFYAGSNAQVAINGGTFASKNADVLVADSTATVTKAEAVEVEAPAGYIWKDGTTLTAVAATIGETGYASLADAIAAANEGDTITLADGTHTMPGTVAGKNITIKGTKNAVVEMLTAVNASGSTVNFNGITAKFDNDGYEGLQHSNKITYTDCTLIGTQFMYAPEVAFTGCTFEMYDAATEYSVWTYGSNNVTFGDCVFNTNGKAILVYNEDSSNEFVANVTLTDCVFNSNGIYNDKAAVELGQSPYGENAYNLVFTNCTAETFVETPKGIPTGSKLWGNKNSMNRESGKGGSSVIIDGSENLMPAAPVAFIGETGYASLADAIAAAKDGDTITLKAGTHTMPGTVAGKNITIEGARGSEEAIVVEVLTAVNASGSTIGFAYLTVKFDNDNYEGFQHAEKITYQRCYHYGTEFLYAPEVSYTDCSFEMYDEKTEYAVWTYGASDVTFKDCSFITNGKAILVYTEAAHTAEINVDSCVFTSNGTYTGKAAIEVGQSTNGNEAKYVLNISNSSANGNFVENHSTSNLWGNKNDMAGEGLYVYIDDVLVYPVVPEGPVVDEELVFVNKGVNAQAYIGAQFMLDTAAAKNYDKVYVVVEHGDKSTELVENIGAEYNIYAFEYRMAAKELADKLVLTAYGVKGDEVFQGESVEWSVQEGSMAALNSANVNTKNATLLARLLAYGAEAQKVFNYNTANLASAGMTQEHWGLVDNYDLVLEDKSSITENSDMSVTILQESLAMQSIVEIQWAISAGSNDISNYEARITVEGVSETIVIDGTEFTDLGSSYYAVLLNALAARQMRAQVQFAVYEKALGKPASKTYTTSIESYAAQFVELGSYAELVKAMMRYGDAARDIFGG